MVTTSRQIQSTPTALGAALIVAAVVVAHVQPASGLIGDTPTIRKIAVGTAIHPDEFGAAGQPIASFLESSDKEHYLRVRTVNGVTGLRMGNDLTVDLDQLMEEEGLVNDQQPQDPPRDMLFSTVFRPGRLLVLTRLGRILEFNIAYDADGSPKLAGPPAIDLRFAHEIVDAADCLTLAEVPNAFDPGNPFIAVGMGDGTIKSSSNLNEDGLVVIAIGPITDLEAIPQVGYFALVAAAGGRLFGVNLDSNPKAAGLEPMVTFDLTQQAGKESIVISSFATGAVLEPSSEPLLTEVGFPVLITDGTSNTYAGWIVPGPHLGGELAIEIVERAPTGVSQAAFLEDGTRCFLTADGSGVYADNGIARLTLAGATVEWLPSSFNLTSNGRSVKAILEVENGVLGTNFPTTVLTVLGGTTISPIDAPVLGDADGDGNPDLTLKFDREEVSALLKLTNASEVLMETVTFIEQQPAWRASAVVRVLR